MLQELICILTWFLLSVLLAWAVLRTASDVQCFGHRIWQWALLVFVWLNEQQPYLFLLSNQSKILIPIISITLFQFTFTKLNKRGFDTCFCGSCKNKTSRLLNLMHAISHHQACFAPFYSKLNKMRVIVQQTVQTTFHFYIEQNTTVMATDPYWNRYD